MRHAKATAIVTMIAILGSSVSNEMDTSKSLVAQLVVTVMPQGRTIAKWLATRPNVAHQSKW